MGNWSRTLYEAERRFEAEHRKFLPVVLPILLLRLYMMESQLTALTDHSGFKLIFLIMESSERLALSRLHLMAYELDIVHRAGSVHQSAKAVLKLNTQSGDTIPILDDLRILCILEYEGETFIVRHDAAAVSELEDEGILAIRRRPFENEMQLMTHLLHAQGEDLVCRQLASTEFQYVS